MNVPSAGVVDVIIDWIDIVYSDARSSIISYQRK